jgi:hypothetical protein
MAGWTYTGAVYPIAPRVNVDGGAKVTDFPALAAGNVGEWQDFAHRVAGEFAALAAQKGWGTTKTLVASANNGAGDVSGVGVLTIALTIA